MRSNRLMFLTLLLILSSMIGCNCDMKPEVRCEAVCNQKYQSHGSTKFWNAACVCEVELEFTYSYEQLNKVKE